MRQSHAAAVTDGRLDVRELWLREVVDYGDAAASMNNLHIGDSFILSEKVKKNGRTSMVLGAR